MGIAVLRAFPCVLAPVVSEGGLEVSVERGASAEVALLSNLTCVRRPPHFRQMVGAWRREGGRGFGDVLSTSGMGVSSAKTETLELWRQVLWAGVTSSDRK